MGVDPLAQGFYGSPVGGAAGLQSLLTHTLSKSGGNYDYSPRDYIVSSLASGAGRSGLIPSLLGGLGQAYLYNKQAESLNQQAQQEAALKQQEELKQQEVKRQLAKYYNIPEQYIEAVAQAKPELLKYFTDQGTIGDEVANTNTYMKNTGNPELTGLPSTQYQLGIMGKLEDYRQHTPTIQGQEMQNTITEQTMPGNINATNAKNNITVQTAPGLIQGTNAKNKAETLYAVPQAEAKLQETQLGNIHAGQQNKYYPQIQENTMRNSNINTHINQQKEVRLQQEAQGLQHFSQTLNQLNNQIQDPNEFRTKSIQTLMTLPLSSQGKQQLMQDIDTVTVLKQRKNVSSSLKTPGVTQPNIFMPKY